jgi:hypothetical protein
MTVEAAAPAPATGCVTCGANQAWAAAAALHAACVTALEANGGDGDEVELVDARMQLQALVHALMPVLPRPPPALPAPLPPSQMALAAAGSAFSASVAGAKRMRGGGVDAAAAAAAARPGGAASRRPPGVGAGAAPAAAATIFSRHPVINRWAREDAQQGSDGRRKGRRAAAAGDDWADLEDFLVVG